MKRTLLTVAIAAAIAAPLAANAATHVFKVNMTGGQEVPANNSPAFASLHAVYDDVTNIFSFISMVGANLVGPNISGFHIHAGPTGGPGSNAPVRLDLGTAGIARVANQFFYLGQNVGPFPQAFEVDLLGGRAYFNLHTNGLGGFPGGEIRGQIAPVPEPSTYAMMLAGLGLVGWVAAKRRKSA